MLDILLGSSIKKGPTDDFWYAPIGEATHAGIHLSEDAAMRFSTVFACIQKIAKTLSTLPVQVYEKSGVRQTNPVDHELNDILDWKGSQNATGISVRSSLHTNRLAWGDGVAEITYSQNGRKVANLTPLMSRNLKPVIGDDGTLLWEHYQDGRLDTVLTPDKYFHDPGPFCYNGLTGITPIQAKETVAGAIAAQTFANTFFGNGAQPGGFLEFPIDGPAGQLSDEQMDRIVETFNAKWQGPKRAHKVGRLREGIKFNQIGMPVADMQLLELRKFSRIEICSIFDVPPPMIQELDPGKYTAIEQAMIAWVRDSLLSIAKATEAAFKRRFFPDSRMYVKHNLAGLARGDTAARSQFYEKGIQWGWFSVNDVRELEDLNPVDGGDEHWIQMNMMPISAVGSVVPSGRDEERESGQAALPPIIVNSLPAPKAPQIDSEGIARLVAESIAASQTTHQAVSVAAFEPVLAAVARQISNKEEKAVRNALKKHAENQESYCEWCDDFFTKHVDFVATAIDPVVCGIERATGQPAQRATDFAERYAEHQLNTARAILGGGVELDAGYLLTKLKMTYLEAVKCQKTN